jgi:hypothetical protein
MNIRNVVIAACALALGVCSSFSDTPQNVAPGGNIESFTGGTGPKGWLVEQLGANRDKTGFQIDSEGENHFMTFSSLTCDSVMARASYSYALGNSAAPLEFKAKIRAGIQKINDTGNGGSGAFVVFWFIDSTKKLPKKFDRNSTFFQQNMDEWDDFQKILNPPDGYDTLCIEVGIHNAEGRASFEGISIDKAK